MITLKFGGTSMANAQRMMNSAAIMISRAEADRISVVVSAVAGVSNKLQESIDAVQTGTNPTTFTTEIETIHKTICGELAEKLPGFNKDSVMAELSPVLSDYEKLLTAVSAFGECPESVHCRIMGIGELLSAPIMKGILKAQKQTVELIDSRTVILTFGSQSEGDPEIGRASCRERV